MREICNERNRMLNHEQLVDEWEKDSQLDQTNLLDSMYEHPKLHAKYLRELQGYRMSLRKQTEKYMTLRSDKIRYFNGEMTKAELDERGWRQYLFKKPLKSEMEALLDADEDLQALQQKSLYVETLVQSCESILKEHSNRTYLYRSMVDYQKFLSGA